MKLRPFGVTVFRAEFGIQVVEQRMERFDIFIFAVQIDAFS